MNAYTIQQNPDRTCSVALAGDLTASTVPALQAELRQQLAENIEEVVFDLANATMLDSSGIGLLIACSNSLARKNGRVRVSNASPDVLQLLQSMRLVKRLNATGRTA